MMDREKVIAQYEAIRRMGQTNMLDKNMVQRIAYENEFYELTNAITEGKYGEILSNYSDWIENIEEENIPVARPVETSYSITENLI